MGEEGNNNIHNFHEASIVEISFTPGGSFHSLATIRRDKSISLLSFGAASVRRRNPR